MDRLTLPLGQAVISATDDEATCLREFLRIGQPARRTQRRVGQDVASVREPRLLEPDAHSDSGYCLYGAPALARLNEIGVAAMDASTPPDDPAVLDMGRRWHALVNAFTGGDPGTTRTLKDAYAREPQVLAAQGMDAAMFAYIRAAMQAAGLTLSA